MLKALPLREDFEEAAPVYLTLVALASNSSLQQRVAHVRPQLMGALQAAVHQEGVPDSVKQSIIEANIGQMPSQMLGAHSQALSNGNH